MSDARFTLIRGLDAQVDFEMLDAEGTAEDLTTAVELTVRFAEAAGETPLVEKTLTGSGVTLVGTGTVHVVLTAADAALLPAGLILAQVTATFPGPLSYASMPVLVDVEDPL
jgi:hypothetical protein